MRKNNLSLTEVSADIRNKLQISKTILELLKSDKKVSKSLINKALRDLMKIEEIISCLSSEIWGEMLSSEDSKAIRIALKEFKKGKSVSWKSIKRD